MKQFDMGDEPTTHAQGGMTHYVNLPTMGKYYPNGHPLHETAMVEVKMLTTREEDILTNPSYIEQGVMIDKLIEQILMVKVPAKEIFEADQMAILVASRSEAYGQDYQVRILCQNCNTEYAHDIDLSSFKAKELDNEVEETEVGSFLVTLPKCDKVIEYKLSLIHI